MRTHTTYDKGIINIMIGSRKPIFNIRVTDDFNSTEVIQSTININNDNVIPFNKK